MLQAVFFNLHLFSSLLLYLFSLKISQAFNWNTVFKVCLFFVFPWWKRNKKSPGRQRLADGTARQKNARTAFLSTRPDLSNHLTARLERLRFLQLPAISSPILDFGRDSNLSWVSCQIEKLPVAIFFDKNLHCRNWLSQQVLKIICHVILMACNVSVWCVVDLIKIQLQFST